jgi:hypothetical protein
MSDVCVIILNWNGWEDTIGCLESILPAVRQGRASAVIVDNASSDCSVMHIDGYMQTTAVASHLSYLSVDETDVIAATCPRHDLALIRSHRNSGFPTIGCCFWNGTWRTGRSLRTTNARRCGRRSCKGYDERAGKVEFRFELDHSGDYSPIELPEEMTREVRVRFVQK